MKDNLFIALRYSIILFFLLLSIVCVILKFYVIRHYASTPIAEVPSWAYIFMTDN